ncbi:hypothetical protein B0T26DRAFT_756091 [Lasiosphaeria miniovina]|uniref:F-box domain-containing protein n=1 Tax=Lasiosphaeria miniovina TaxID=1954250 RepID=A0AA39ZZP0_9PEZI|nr:uncharacterized protein B0T26DRAFT_756091 [Lasiosphaeria miniovina]KAK0706603.1 hypothetical protein B0T26DRAFT_756091 [Lasiosphaeria miniovina]
MDRLLADHLDALRANVQLRRDNLQNLIPSLTAHEIRELRQQLDAVDFRTDILARLPVELHLLVADYVDGADIYSFLTVSRRWRRIWLQDRMRRLLADRWLPGLRRYTEEKERLTAEGQDQPAIFYDAARRLHFRSLGKFQAIFVHPEFEEVGDDGGKGALESYFPLDPTCRPVKGNDEDPWKGILHEPPKLNLSAWPLVKYLYSSGRLAWQSPFAEPNNSLVFVDDLRTKLRRVYQLPDLTLRGPNFQLRAFGDKLVVVSVSRTLYAWHLETRQLDMVTLPTALFKCETKGTRVYIYNEAAIEIWAWTFKSGLRAIDTTEMRTYVDWTFSNHNAHRREDYQIGVLFHPLVESTVFFAIPMVKVKAVAVFEYKNERYSCLFASPVPQTTYGCPYAYRILEVHVHSAPINSYGLYMIAAIHVQSLDPLYRPPPDISLICFNTLDCSFSSQDYRVPSVERKPVLSSTIEFTPAWWHGQMTAWVDLEQSYRNEDLSEEDAHLVTTRELGTSRFNSDSVTRVWKGEQQPRLQIRRAEMELDKMVEGILGVPCSPDLTVNDVARVRGKVASKYSADHVQYCLDISGLDSVLHNDVGREVILDDDFIVLLHAGGYIIWSFYTDTPVM